MILREIEKINWLIVIYKWVNTINFEKSKKKKKKKKKKKY